MKSFSDGEVGRQEDQDGKAKCAESNYQRAESPAGGEATSFTKAFLREMGFVGCIF